MAVDEMVEARIALELAEPTGENVPETALSEAELVEWQRLEDELDGFLSSVIIALATATENRSLQLDLLGALLDTRLSIAKALIEGSEDDVTDPIRDLFVASWDLIRPVALELERNADAALFPGLSLTTFMAGADAIATLDALGPEYGIEISRDGIRRLARMLLADQTPASFTPLSLALDPQLQGLFASSTGGSEKLSPQNAAHWLPWLVTAAHATAEEDTSSLNLTGLVPQLSNLDEYLDVVSKLLARHTDEQLAASDRIPAEVALIFNPLVMATAWKESCWRHYLNEEVPPEVIRSSIGAIGMMQINGRVWRGLYDLDRLEREISYNISAGIEILEHYLVHYALRRGEHLQPGGPTCHARPMPHITGVLATWHDIVARTPDHDYRPLTACSGDTSSNF
jgi:hypothetical protein